MDTKKCSICHRVKPVSEFFLRRGKPRSACKICWRNRYVIRTKIDPDYVPKTPPQLLTMEQSLDEDGCMIVREFFQWALRYAKEKGYHDLDISVPLKAYRIYRNGRMHSQGRAN